MSGFDPRLARRLLLALVAPVLVASGCSVKPPPSATEIWNDSALSPDLPQQWAASASAGEVPSDWVASFGDTQLSALVEEALLQNADLQASAARVERAAGFAKAAGAHLYPTVDLLGKGGTGMGGDSSGLSAIVVLASWEIDIWGRVRAGRAAAVARYGSAESEYRFARQSLAAITVKTVFVAIEGRLQQRIAEEMVGTSGELADLMQVRQEVGRGNERDVVLARADRAKYQDSVIELEQANDEARRGLESILGRYPAAAIEFPEDLVALPPPVPAGLPAELLERRPDLVAAERRVASAFHSVQEAKAARLPQISLTASFGALSSDVLQLKEDFENPVASIGASLLAPIFRGGQLQAQVDIRTAEQREALAQYAGVALAALTEVENALAAESKLSRRQEILEEAVRSLERALEIARIQNDVGMIDLFTVLQQQQALYVERSKLLRVRSERLIQRVNLHLALGGAFDAPAQTP
jgi:NodT family efflux transporter outer membrane factor (OMF) lipoprotein